MSKYIFVFATLFFLNACSSGGGAGSSASGGQDEGCDGACPESFLEAGEVSRIVAQASEYSKRLGVAGTFAVLDRVGNVLAVYQMNGAPQHTMINGQIGAVGGLEGTVVPSTLAAISKAGTGAFLSSQGNAFSSRTASQIVQEHFDPGEQNQGGGPLFGVQFSQLICSDITQLGAGSVGPRPLPLGLSADPGGLPLYKSGSLVGGIGVELNGIYTFDRNIRDVDPIDQLSNIEEQIAVAASLGFEAPRKQDSRENFCRW